MIKSLKELAIKFNTDKEVDTGWNGGGHQYSNFYDLHLSSLRHDNLKILEIGIFAGASLRMWEEYFYNSIIYGIDNLADAGSTLVNEGRIRSFQVDAGNEEQIKIFVNTHGPFDVIIDDGSHFTNHQWMSWDLLSSQCKIFVWEDLHSSRIPYYMRGTRDGKYPIDFARELSMSYPSNNFFFDRDGDEKHVTFLKKNEY